MKLACSSAAYDAPLREGRIDLRGFIRTCADDLDVDGVSIAAAHITTTDAVYLRDLKKLCVDAHLTVASLSVDTVLASPERCDAEVERIKQWCDVAAYLGAPIVTLTAGLMPQPRPLDRGRIVGLFRKVFGEEAPNVRRAWSDVMWALRQCADHAAGYGLALAVRNQRGALIDAPHQLWQSVRDVGSPWLRACPDPAAMRDRTAFDLPLQYAVEVSATVGDVRDDGSDTATHWPEILRLLRAARYRGFVTLDYAAATASAEPADAAMPRAARYMRGLLHLLARQEMLRSPNGDASETVPLDYRVVRPAADSDFEVREVLAGR